MTAIVNTDFMRKACRNFGRFQDIVNELTNIINLSRTLTNMSFFLQDARMILFHKCHTTGGMFAVEEQAVSVCMGRDKVKDHIATGAEYIVGADSSCLIHMQGVIKREHLPIQIIHIVEILASQS